MTGRVRAVTSVGPGWARGTLIKSWSPGLPQRTNYFYNYKLNYYYLK